MKKLPEKKRCKLEVYEDAKGEYRWRLKARNGQIIAISGEGYTRRSDCKSTQQMVSVAMREAKIVDIESD